MQNTLLLWFITCQSFPLPARTAQSVKWIELRCCFISSAIPGIYLWSSIDEKLMNERQPVCFLWKTCASASETKKKSFPWFVFVFALIKNELKSTLLKKERKSCLQHQFLQLPQAVILNLSGCCEKHCVTSYRLCKKELRELNLVYQGTSCSM